MANLRLDDVTKIYGPRKGGVLAVDRLNLDLADGEILALLGSSGCGKTSTLRMIAGFENVTEGTIRLGTRAIHALAPAERDVAMAFEGYSLYPPLSVRENIAFALLRGKIPKSRIKAQTEEIAGLLEIEDILERYPTSIASGQQQRASLARALVRPAQLYLLDEPMSQLEPRLRAILRSRIKDWINSRRLTTVFVTHDQTEAMALADRIAVMEKGELQQFGTPADLIERPANTFVASFIGEPAMNLMPARVVHDGEGTVAVAAGGAIRLRLPRAARQLADGTSAYLGLRPHRLAIGGSDIKGAIVANFWLGDQSHVALDVGGERVVVTTARTVTEPLGGEIGLGVSPAAIHLFDGKTGRALLHAGEPA